MSVINEFKAWLSTATKQMLRVTVDNVDEGVYVAGNYTYRYDTTSTVSTIYVGVAAIGASESAAVWQISKWDTSGVIDLLWADTDQELDNIWDNRVGLSYG